jgi:hypothetical protein
MVRNDGFLNLSLQRFYIRVINAWGPSMKKRLLFAILCIYSQSKFISLNAQTTTDAAATGISRAFNPAISVNVLFSGMASDTEIPLWEDYGVSPGLHLQGEDLEITANVDVYLQSKVVLGGSETEDIGIEEAYLTSLRMPIPVILRGGKMLSTFGRYNLYHLHHMAFAENPLILNYIFQPKLNEVSLEASYLVPLPWYSELLGGILNGNNEALFNSEKQGDFAYLLHFDNFWDFSDETTFRLGASYLSGARGLYYATAVPFDSAINSITSLVWGLDFQLKWKPLQYDRYSSFVLEGEYVNASLDINNKMTGPLHGYYVQALYQIDLNHWIQMRYEWFNRPEDLANYFASPSELSAYEADNFSGKRISIALAYVPTEFSAYRLQYNYLQFANTTEQQIIFQVNVTIGSHPAHKY